MDLDHADHHRPINTQLTPLDENRRAARVLIRERDSHDAHNLRYQNLSRQPEKILPSVEGRLRSMNYQQGAFSDVTEPNSRFGPESPSSSRRGRHTPRVINPDDTELHATKYRRVDGLSILSADKPRQSPHDYHQERAYLVSRNPDNELSGPRQNYGAPSYQSTSDKFPVEERSMLVHPESASRHSGRQAPARGPLNQMDHAIQRSYIKYDGLERPRNPELAQVPLVRANSVAQRQVFLSSVHKSVDVSQSFPALHSSPKQLPVLHGSRPSGTLHRDGTQIRREAGSHVGVDYRNSSTAILDEHVRRMPSDSARQFIEPEYRRHHMKDEQGVFDSIPKTYLSPRKVRDDVQIYERPRTGILLRKVSDGRQAVHDGRELHLTEPSSRPHERLSSQYQIPGSLHESSDTQQNEISLRETLGTNPTQLASGFYDRRWYVPNQSFSLQASLEKTWNRIC